MTQSISTDHSTDYVLYQIGFEKNTLALQEIFLFGAKQAKGECNFFLIRFYQSTFVVHEPLHCRLEFLKRSKIWELELFFVMSSLLCNLQHLLTNKKNSTKSFLFVHTTLFEVVN